VHYLRHESRDCLGVPQQLDGGGRSMARDCFHQQRTALPTVLQQPEPKIDALARPPNRAPRASKEREVQEDDRVGSSKSDFDGVIGSEVPVPSFSRTSFCWSSTHCCRGVSTSPDCQKLLSSSITRNPVISPSCRASTDLPEAQGPIITTRRMWSVSCGCAPRHPVMAGNADETPLPISLV
jgi:hypothetical protein